MANRTNIEWDKNDIDLLGCVKIDVLSLGMLTCLHKAFDLLRKHYGVDLNLGNVPWDDPEVYKMISMADTIGLFQIESRAQQSMLPRLRPKTFRELVIQVAIVRPGSIVGGMVHPYIRRSQRGGTDRVSFGRIAWHTGIHEGCTPVSGAGDEDRDGGSRLYRQ